jgi:hypothetical protein
MDKTMSPARANALAFALAPLVLALFYLPHFYFWGGASLGRVFGTLVSPFLGILAVSIVIHEALHGLGFVLGGRVARRDLRFGVKGVSVYAHCTVPIAVSAYRFATVLPGVVLGLVPGLAGIALGNAWLTVFGSLMCIAALGDVLILWLLRSVPKDALVEDHPTAPGCRVLI